MLSGFILAYVYSTGRKFGAWRFFAARIVRLWPAHVTSIVIMWLVAPRAVTGKFTMGKLAATLMMTHAWLPFPEYWVSFECAALFVFLFTLWEAPAWAARVTQSGVFGSEVVGLWLTAGSACFGGAALLFVLAQEQGLMARLFSFSPFVLLGKLSYAIYLVHQSILLLFWNHRKDFANVPLWAVFPIISLTILAVAYLIWVIESPCRYLLSKLWSRSSIKMAIELPASMISPKGVAVRSSSVPIVLPAKRGILIASTVLLLVWALAVFHSRIYS